MVFTPSPAVIATRFATYLQGHEDAQVPRRVVINAVGDREPLGAPGVGLSVLIDRLIRHQFVRLKSKRQCTLDFTQH
jgi:hypothetical protein